MQCVCVIMFSRTALIEIHTNLAYINVLGFKKNIINHDIEVNWDTDTYCIEREAIDKQEECDYLHC